MAELKTKVTDQNVEDFLNGITDDKRREDSFAILKLMKETTGDEPKMWGSSIVGFGDYHYKYQSGREGDWFIVGFSPRKQNLSLYIMPGVEAYREELKKLGKYKAGKSCLYINKVEDIDLNTMKKIIKTAVGRKVESKK